MSPANPSSQRFKHAGHTAWRRVEKESIILDLDTSVYYSLNETGAFIWERLGAGDTASQVAAGLSAEFEVKAAAAEKDVKDLIRKLSDEKLLAPL